MVSITTGPPAPFTLPASQADKLFDIREAMLRNMVAAVEDYDALLQPAAERLRQEIRRAEGLPRAKRSRAVRAAVRRFYGTAGTGLGQAIGGLFADADGFVQRYERGLVDYRVSERLDPEAALAGSEAVAGIAGGAGGAGAAVALAARQLGTEPAPEAVAAVRREAVDDMGQGFKRRMAAGERAVADLRRAGEMQPYPDQGLQQLSKRIHGQALADSREASRVVLRAIREGQNVEEAARDLQRLVGKRGLVVGGKEELPRLVRELKDAGRALAAAGGPAEQAEWSRVRRQLARYTRGLKPGSTVQKGYVELLRRLQRPKFRLDQLDGVVDRWGYWKQRHVAERHIRTQQAAAYRARQVEQDARQRAWIVGYIWRLNRRAHTKWVKGGRSLGKPGPLIRGRRPSGRKALGGARCICEVMNGKLISVETAREYPNGGHPHCNCTFEPVYNRAAMLSAPVTAEEERLLGLDEEL
jgi:hypothetical protein